METGVIYSIHMAPLLEIFVNSAVQSYIAIATLDMEESTDRDMR